MGSNVQTTTRTTVRGFAICVLLSTITVPLTAQEIVLRAGTLLDGKGGVLRSASVIVENGRIKSTGQAPDKRVSYDLTQLTLLPGLIDTHVHINTHFGKNGRATSENEAPEDSMLYAA